MTSTKHLQMLQRRLNYLQGRNDAGQMMRAEADALRWAIDTLRPLAVREVQRMTLADPCRACKTPAGYTCVHLA